MNAAIDQELARQLSALGKTLGDLDHFELVERRYQIHLAFRYGRTAEEARVKEARLYAALDAGQVPTLETVVSFPIPGAKVA